MAGYFRVGLARADSISYRGKFVRPYLSSLGMASVPNYELCLQVLAAGALLYRSYKRQTLCNRDCLLQCTFSPQTAPYTNFWSLYLITLALLISFLKVAACTDCRNTSGRFIPWTSASG